MNIERSDYQKVIEYFKIDYNKYKSYVQCSNDLNININNLNTIKRNLQRKNILICKNEHDYNGHFISRKSINTSLLK